MDNLKRPKKALKAYECVLMLPSFASEEVISSLNLRLNDRLKARGATFVKVTEWGKLVLACKGKRQEARWCMHFWFKTNQPEVSLEVVRNVSRNVKALKWTFYKTDCFNANVKLHFPIVHCNRKLLS
ncbi:MAG: 30S ribosomal protein S6 [Candidatus Hodgkinia cicadicola]